MRVQLWMVSILRNSTQIVFHVFPSCDDGSVFRIVVCVRQRELVYKACETMLFLWHWNVLVVHGGRFGDDCDGLFSVVGGSIARSLVMPAIETTWTDVLLGDHSLESIVGVGFLLFP